MSPRLSDIVGPRHKVLKLSGGCHNCPRRLKDHVPPTLADDSVIWVGEAPGAEEVWRGEGFVGRSGSLIREVAADCGLEVRAVSNILKCRPPKNRNPTAKEISCCMAQFTSKDVEGYPFVVLVGKIAAEAFFPGVRWQKIRGNLTYHPDYPGQRFLSIYHPAWALRQGREGRKILEVQVSRLARVLKGKGEVFPITTPADSDFFEILDSHLECRRVSFDIETNSLRSWEPDARVISFALTGDGEEVVFVHEDDPAFTGAAERVRTFLEDPSKQILGHNIGFDLDFMEKELRFAVKTRTILDTQYLWYLATGGMKLPSLKRLASEELDGYQHLVYDPSTETDVDILMQYNAEDVIYPWRLFEKGFERLSLAQRDLFLRVGGPSSLFLQRVHTTGIYIHQDRHKEVKDDLKARRAQALQDWQEEDPDFRPAVLKSEENLHHYLFETKNLPVVKVTPTGQPATNATALKMLVRDHGATYLDHLLAIRGIDKRQSTNVEGFKKHILEDGRVHPSYYGTTTDSGRTSSRNPNGQNIPRDRDIRDFFGTPAGSFLLTGDYNQIELRIAMCRAGDPAGIAAYMSGSDLHTQTAREILGRKKISKADRTDAKAINFSLIYGGTAYTLQRHAFETYGISFTDRAAQKYVDGFFDTHTRLKPYHAEIISDLRSNRGHVETVIGHYHYYPAWDDVDHHHREHVERAVINSHAQGPASYMTIYLGILTGQRLREGGFWPAVLEIGTIHDSLMWQLQKGIRRRDVIDEILWARGEVADWVAPWFEVPLVMDFEYGTSWGSAKELSI